MTQCLVAAIWFWLVTSGTGQFYHHGFFLSNVYDSVAKSLLALKTDVDPNDIASEAIVVNGRVHTYFGIFPALLRVIPNALFPEYYGQWNRLSCFIAALLCMLAFQVVVRLRLDKNARLSDTQKTYLHSLLVAGFGLGTPIVFILSSSFIYHEAIIWGLAGSLSAVLFFFRLLNQWSARSEFLFSCSTAVAMLSRVTFGAPLFPVHLAMYLWQRRAPESRRGLPRFWTILPAILGLVVLLWVNYERFGSVFTTFDYRSHIALQRDPEVLALLDQSGFMNFRRIPTNTASYFGVGGADYSSVFPFVRMTIPKPPDRRLYPAHQEPTLPLTISAPWLLLLGATGVVLLLRNRFCEPPVWLLLICLLGECGLMLMFLSIHERYTAEFIPFFAALGVTGLPWLYNDSVRRWPSAAFGVVLTIFVGVSVYVSFFSTLASIAEYLGPDPYWSGVPESFGRSVDHFLTGAARPESTQTLLARGIQAHGAGQYDTAMELYHQVLHRDPANSAVHYNLGQIYNARKQYPQAQWEYELALKADPKALDPRINLGIALYWQKKFSEAAREFRQVLEASPNNPMASYDLGITLVETGETGEAIKWLKEALKQNPKNASTYYYLGLANERQKSFAEAENSFKKALELVPGYADAYTGLARVYKARGQDRSAQEATAKAVKLNPALKKP